jgi:hypothetical protein
MKKPRRLPFKAWLVMDNNGFYEPMFHLKLKDAQACLKRYEHLQEAKFKVVPVKVDQWSA